MAKCHSSHTKIQEEDSQLLDGSSRAILSSDELFVASASAHIPWPARFDADFLRRSGRHSPSARRAPEADATPARLRPHANPNTFPFSSSRSGRGETAAQSGLCAVPESMLCRGHFIPRINTTKHLSLLTLKFHMISYVEMSDLWNQGFPFPITDIKCAEPPT
jgi:hypothetical protein